MENMKNKELETYFTVKISELGYISKQIKAKVGSFHIKRDNLLDLMFVIIAKISANYAREKDGQILMYDFCRFILQDFLKEESKKKKVEELLQDFDKNHYNIKNHIKRLKKED